MAVDISRMTDVQAFKERMDRQIDFIKASPVASNTEEVYLPGELEYRSFDRQMKDGIVYPVEIIREIREIAGEFKVADPEWLKQSGVGQ